MQTRLLTAPSSILLLILLTTSLPALGQLPSRDWLRQISGPDFVLSSDVATDAAGNAFITGSFYETITFGAGEPGETSLTSAGSTDLFVACYSASGAFIWARRAGSEGSDAGSGIAANLAGEVAVTGSFSGTVVFGAGEPGETSLTSPAGQPGVFVARYQADGSLLWARQAGAPLPGASFGIALDDGGHTYLVGEFRDVAVFGPSDPGEATLTSAGEEDLFVAKYGPDGALAWARRAGGPAADEALDVALNAYEEVLVAGSFTDAAVFGPGEPGETALTSAGGEDLFGAVFSADGALLRVHSAGGEGSDFAATVASDAEGNLLLHGTFADRAVFAAGEPGETTVTSLGPADVFLAKYGADGTLRWVRRGGSPELETSRSLVVYDNGNAVISGGFNGMVIFEAGPAGRGEANLVSQGGRDLYTVGYDANGDLLTLHRAGGPEDVSNPASALDEEGSILTVGTFRGTLTFDEPYPGPVSITSQALGDAFLVKYTMRSVDATPPVIALAHQPLLLWPPDSSYYTLLLDDIVTSLIDDTDTTITSQDVVITRVTSNEPPAPLGGEEPILLGGDCRSVMLQQAREATGYGRVYGIELGVLDTYGNAGTSLFQVMVPVDSAAHAYDNGVAYAVEGCQPLPPAQQPPSVIATGTSDEHAAAAGLEGNYPNPFNPSTEIVFTVQEPAHVRLVVYDLLGRPVARLVDGPLPAGRHATRFDARALPSGAYLYRFEAGALTQTRSMVLLK
jgi:hypothetical protein